MTVTNISLAFRSWKGLECGFQVLWPTDKAGRRGVNFLVNKRSRSQSPSWGVVEPGLTARPSGSEAAGCKGQNDSAPRPSGTTQAPTAPGTQQCSSGLSGGCPFWV